jgi:hypothetical protein
MNNQSNQRQVGRMTGRIAVDAGIMNYREQLARASNSSASRRSSSVNNRRGTGVVVAMLLLVLALSVGAAAQVAGIGCAYLTPGSSGSGSAFAGIERAPGIGLSIVAESSGSFELSAAGRNLLEVVARYNGELCSGPYVFAP